MHAFYRGKELTLTRGRVTLDMKVAIGATGAPTLDTEISRGISSIARTGVGAYTITLKEAYHDFLGMNPTVLDADDPGVDWIGPIEDLVATVGTQTLKIVCRNAGTATELDSGSTLYIQLYLRYAADNG
jgi:hypothetical protein